MNQGKANDELEDVVMWIANMATSHAEGGFFHTGEVRDRLSSLLERRVSEARIMELSDAAKTFTDSSSISYTGQQIHQIINSRIDYARSPETPAEPWRKSKAE